MTYTLHYVTEDCDDHTWQVRAENYESIDADEPIDGTDRLVATGFATEQDADDRARHLQVRSYAEGSQ